MWSRMFSSPQKKASIGLYSFILPQKKANTGLHASRPSKKEASYKCPVRSESYSLSPVSWIVHSEIHIETFIGHRAMVEYILLHEPASIESRDHNRNTPLHIAVNFGQRAIASLLLEAGASIESQDIDETRALHKAVYASQESIVRLLCEHKAELNHMTAEGESPLFIAACDCRKDILRILLEYGASSDYDYARTLLRNPVSNQDKECVGYLLDMGFDINCGAGGETVLHFAPPRSAGTFISYLIGKGANIEALDSYNRTSLHRAAAQDDICPVKPLIDAGANIYSKDKSGLTPLHRAAASGKQTVVE